MSFDYDRKHDDENDDCDCFDCLEKDYNDPNGSWFPDGDGEDVA